MMVTKQTALPATKTMKRHRHRQGHIDADHADLNLAHEFARHAAVAGKNGDTIGVLIGVNQINRAGNIFGAQHAQHWPKNFFFINRHVRGDVIEQGAADKKALLAPRHSQTATVHDQSGTLVCTLPDQLFNALFCGPSNHRPHFSTRCHAVVNFQIARALSQGGNQLIARSTDRHRHRNRHTAFTG